MGSGRLLIWTIQGIIALCQGRILYLYSITSSQQDIRKTILTIALLYASAAFSMTVLLLVFHGKRDLRITLHAFWTTVIFPVIATVLADIFYIKVSGRFFMGLFFLLFAAVIYIVAGLGLSMLCIRIFGHSTFQPFTPGKRITVRSGYGRHGSIRSNYTGSRSYKDHEYSDREYRGKEYRDSEFREREYRGTEFKGWGFDNMDHNGRVNRDSDKKESEQLHRSSVIIPDYKQEYIDKIDRDYIDKLDQNYEDQLTLVHPNDRPVYYGSSKSRTMVAYINRDNQVISCDKRSSGYSRLGRIASSGELYEYSGGAEAYAGFVTTAGYVRSAAGLDIGCVDEDGNVFRYEGEGALDMTHAKTLVGKVNPGDYSAGAAFLLLLRNE